MVSHQRLAREAVQRVKERDVHAGIHIAMYVTVWPAYVVNSTPACVVGAIQLVDCYLGRQGEERLVTA